MWPFQRVFYYRIHPLAMGMGAMIGFILTGYLTIIRRRRSEYSRGIISQYSLSLRRMISIIAQVIIRANAFFFLSQET